MNPKRYTELDTLRVISALLVIISHYSYYFSFGELSFISKDIAGVTGRVGVCLFFFISGFLTVNSLDKDNTFIFYLKKYVRIEFPYLAAYFFMSFLFIVLSLINSQFLYYTPLYKIMTEGGDLLKFIPVLFGLDGILNGHIAGLNYLFFTGEWFIGSVIGLYLLSPILYFLLKRLNAFVLLGIMAIVSSFVYFYVKSYINNPFWFFLCRIPEFLLGMIIYNNISYIKKNSRVILITCLAFIGLFTWVGMLVSDNSFIADKIIPNTPVSFIISIPIITLIYMISLKLNNKWDLHFLNKYAKYIYMVMLLQHVIIITFIKRIYYKDFSLFGYFALLFCIIILIFLLAKLVLSFEKPFENAVINKFFKNKS